MIKSKKIKVILILIQTILAYLLTVYILNNTLKLSLLFNVDIFLFLIIWLISFLALCHFFIPIKKLYHWLFQKRFILSFLLLILLVLGKFNGSSYGMWNTYIEPNYPVSSLNSIMAPIRAIRSDEWFVNSPHVLSQFNNDFAYYNSYSRGISTDMFTTLPVPIKSILLATKPFLIGYLVLGKDYGMSFYWWSRLIVLFLVTFEFFRIFTKDNRQISLLGTILVTFSPAIFWWYSQYLVEQLIGGNLAIIMFYYLLHSKEKKKKILFSLGLGFGFLIFFFTLYPAWLVPLGYFYLLLALYLLYDYHQKEKIKLKDLAYLLIPLSIFAIFLTIFLTKSYETIKIISNTIYPGQRNSLGNEGFLNLFYYPISLFLPYKPVDNPCDLALFYSFFPLSIIYGIEVLIKERKKLSENYLLLIIIILVILLSAFTIFKIPSFLARITLLSNVTGKRLSVIISFISLFIFILLANKKIVFTSKEKIWLFITTILCSILTILVTKNAISSVFVLSKKAFLIAFIVLLIPSLSLVFSHSITKKILTLSIIIISFISTIWVNPLMKGFNGIYEKPLAKELVKYQTEDKKWLILDSFVLPNYFLANGLKVINSTNVYPNLTLYHLLDKDLKYEDTYNRYAHVEIKLTNDKTSFTSPYEDQVHIALNPTDLCLLNVDYLGSLTDVSKFSNQNISFKELYHLDNIYLYQVTCKNS